MTKEELIRKLQEMPSDLPICVVDAESNEHFYDIYAHWIHISGNENWFEISFERRKING